MNEHDRLDRALELLRISGGHAPDAHFMDGVWHRAGQLAERAEARRRLGLFAASLGIGLASGFLVTEAPAGGQAGSHALVASHDLSAAGLLKIGS